MRLSRLTTRQWLIVAHDLIVTAAALGVTLLLRFEDAQLAARLEWLRPVPTVAGGRDLDPDPGAEREGR